jgi:hypothetical protein
MRWDNGTTLRPVGGWERYDYAPFPDKIRKMHRWLDNDNNMLTAYLCESHVYVDIGGSISDITPIDGMVIPTGNNGGYGDNDYNEGLYGTARSGESRLRLYTPVYSMDNWGEDLRVMTSADGRLLGWSPTTPATPLVAIENAPVSNRSFIITPERHIMLFGMGGEFNKFGWCDEEDDTDWTFTDITNKAGFFDVSPTSPIIAHELFNGGIVMWTPTMTYVITYAGLPYIYSYKSIGKVSVPISPASATAIPTGVIWPSIDGWWIYDGSVPHEIRCDVWDFLDKHMDVNSSRFRAAAVHMHTKGELWWFFVAIGLGVENSRYVCYDYRSNIWSMGKLGRTCGFSYPNDRYPVMATLFDVWKHEIGWKYSNSEFPWIESASVAPNGGEHRITLNKFQPDISGDRTAVEFSVVKSNDRTDYTKESRSPPRRVNEYGWVDIRETAQDMRLRIDMVKESNWGTVGPLLVDGKLRGKK